MKKSDYKKWPDEKLQKQLKSLKFATGLLSGLLIVLFAATLYISISEARFHPLLISPIALSAIIPMNLKRINDWKKELALRMKINQAETE